MKKLHITTFILFISTLINAQNNSSNYEVMIVKVKAVKSVENLHFCKSADEIKDAVVVEFDVVNDMDIEKFGNRIYAIAICGVMPSKETQESREILDLKISEFQEFNGDIKILNSELLDRNRNKTKFWVKSLSRIINVYCDTRKQ